MTPKSPLHLAVLFACLFNSPAWALGCVAGEPVPWPALVAIALALLIVGLLIFSLLRIRNRALAGAASGRHGWEICLGLLATLPAVGIALFGVFIVPKFAAVFESFGADLPLGTRILMVNSNSLVLIVLPLLVAFYLKRIEKRINLLSVLVVVNFGLLLAVRWILYIPMGEAC